jgi:PAS domain S-box-containing protein
MTAPRSTIKGKLMTAIMGTSITVLVLTCAAFIVYEVVMYRRGLGVGLSTRAEIVAANSTAALAFENQADATTVLAAFRRDPRIVEAALYDRHGRLFAKYPAAAPDSLFPRTPEGRARHFHRSDVVVFQPVELEGRWLGTVYLQSDLSALTERYQLYALLVAIVLASSILLAFLLSTWLQKRIAEPILLLTETARAVSERRDYSLRTAKETDDEIGLLTDAFNEMLDEIRRRETALRASEARLRAILASALDGIVTIDEQGRIVEFNPAAEKLFGHARAEVLGVSIVDLIVPSVLRDRYRAALTRQLSTGANEVDRRMELTGLGSDGHEIPLEVAITRVRLEGPPIFTGFLHDITERRSAEREIRQLNTDLERRVAVRTGELEAANRELEAFSYSVSHDLRAPLRAVDGFSRLVLEDYGARLDETGAHYLEQVRVATRNMSQLIDDMLNLSKISRVEMTRQRVDLGALASEVATQLRDSEPGRQVTFVIPEGLTVEGDPRLLSVVIDNLMRNAWKFTTRHATARIELGCVVEDGRSVYFVRDDGAGFDMAHAGQLFNPFQRLHRQNEFEGTGIGLTIVQRIIQRHEGTLRGEAAVEKGATFYFALWDRHTEEDLLRGAVAAAGIQRPATAPVPGM